MIIAVDDPDRENEGDLICAAEHATLENVNFMASYGQRLDLYANEPGINCQAGIGANGD